MTITIECTPKELADAVLQLQRQPEPTICIGPEGVVRSVQDDLLPSDG